MKEKILITGAGGFIGHHLNRFLKKKGYYTVGVDIEKPHFSSIDEYDQFILMDLRNPSHCEAVTHGINKVYNLAAMNGSIEMTTTNKAELIHNNALVNLNMAEACWKNKVKRVFYSSSACVYPIHYQDSDEVHALKEEDVDPAHPDTEYGWEKLFSEHLWMDYAEDRGLEVRIARFINIYGPECLTDTLRSKAPMALTKKVIEAGNGGNVKIWGDGNQKRTFCYIDDLVRGVDLLMESDIKVPINLGSDNLVSINHLVEMIAKIEGVKVKKTHQLNKIQGVRVRQADLTKAETLLGWHRKISLKEGLTKVNTYAHKILDK